MTEREVIINQVETSELPPTPVIPNNSKKIITNDTWINNITNIFNGKEVPGLEQISSVDFDMMLKIHVDNYTIFIEGQYLFHALRHANLKVKFRKLLQAPKLAKPLYYYNIWDSSQNDLVQSFRELIKNNPDIKGYFEGLDLSKYKKNHRVDGIYQEINYQLLPTFYVDLLALIYRVSELNFHVNAIVLLSNNQMLIPAIKELVENDIAVYLGVSKHLKTSIKMMEASSAVIDLELFLTKLQAVTEFKKVQK